MNKEIYGKLRLWENSRRFITDDRARRNLGRPVEQDPYSFEEITEEMQAEKIAWYKKECEKIEKELMEKYGVDAEDIVTSFYEGLKL
ncbi:hypothetical protein [Bacillus sp. TE9122W]